MVERSGWMKMVDADPEHSLRYADRFRAMANAGDDLAGEARFVDAMVGRGSRILDAGCGPGRVGGFLFELGHDVVGVDVDTELIAAAEQDHRGPLWLVGDLAELDLAAHGVDVGFDVIVCAGNVMTFLAPSTRRDVLAGMRRHLAPTGRVVVGFGSGRGYEFGDFFTDVRAVGLNAEVELGTWDIRPFADDSDFLVAVLGPDSGQAEGALSAT